MKISAIITAGGSSSRYGNKNKLLEKINDKTIIEYSTEAFYNRSDIFEIIIPAHKCLIDEFEKIFINKTDKIKIIEGGNVRQESVYKALKSCSNPAYVIIHDGARPLIEQKDIDMCLSLAVKTGAAIAVSKIVDTIKTADKNGKITSTVPRDFLYAVQTPQIFKYDMIFEAHKKLQDKSFTDDALLLETLNIPVYISESNKSNIKITTPEDLFFIKEYLNKNIRNML